MIFIHDNIVVEKKILYMHSKDQKNYNNLETVFSNLKKKFSLLTWRIADFHAYRTLYGIQNLDNID